jgi:acylphosphatase
MLQTISIVVKGKVQGVYYRQSTKKKATELGITGKVKNMADGSVLITACGSPEQLYQLTEWCKAGPPGSIVTGLVVTELPVSVFYSFLIEQ